MSAIQDEFRMIISHALLGCDTEDVDKETWDLVMSECEKFSLKLCNEQKQICSRLVSGWPNEILTENEIEERILNAPIPKI